MVVNSYTYHMNVLLYTKLLTLYSQMLDWKMFWKPFKIYIYISLYVQDDGNCLYCYDRNDSIMLPSVFNDLFEGEEEGSHTTSSFEIFSILTFKKWILQAVQ